MKVLWTWELEGPGPFPVSKRKRERAVSVSFVTLCFDETSSAGNVQRGPVLIHTPLPSPTLDTWTSRK